jgi:outer membrane protein TolC
MKPYKFLIIVLCLHLLPYQAARAQDTTRMSLAQAIEFAEKNSPALKNALVDVDLSKQTVNQVASIGLPQVTASGSYMQYLQVPGSWVNNFFPSPGAPDYVFIQFQQPITSQGTLAMNQLIYSGSYLLGLKAAREFINVNQLMVAKTKNDLHVNVAKAYLMALTLKKNINLINSNLSTLDKSLKDVTALQKEGFAEKLDVQRLELAVSNLKVQKEKLEAGVTATLNVLKLQMGMDVNKPLNLTDDLETVDKTIPALTSEMQIKNRVEFKLLEQSLSLNLMDEKRWKVNRYPSLVGFVQHQQTTQRPEFNFFKSNLTPNNNWIPSTAFGFSVQATLFDGLKTKANIAEVRLKRAKIQNDIAAFENYAGMEYQNALSTYNNNLQQVITQKQNLELAQEIYTKANIKYKEGVGSSLEILQAETDLKNSQTNYLNALYDLVISKIDLKKATGTDLMAQ